MEALLSTYPEKIRILSGTGVHDRPVRQHRLSLDNLVEHQPPLPRPEPIPSKTSMPTGSDLRASPMRESPTRLIEYIQSHLTQPDPRLDVGQTGGAVDGDAGEVGRADHEGTVGFAET